MQISFWQNKSENILLWGPFLLWSGKLLYSYFTFLRASHIEEISFPSHFTFLHASPLYLISVSWRERSGKLLYSHFTFLGASHIEEISFSPLPYKCLAHAYKAEGGRRFIRCGMHVKKWSESTRVSHSTTKTAPIPSIIYFYILDYVLLKKKKILLLDFISRSEEHTSELQSP